MGKVRLPVTALPVLLRHLHQDMCKSLKEDGFTIRDEARNNLRTAVLDYFKVRHRTIPVQPYEVVWARALQKKQLPMEQLAALETIENECREGLDMNVRVTRQYHKGGFSDGFLNDLKIQHFHLGKRGAGKRGQAEGTKELLYGFMTPATIYFLDVLGHDFKTAAPLKIVQDNWPDLLVKYESKGLRGSVGPEQSPEDTYGGPLKGVTVVRTIGGRTTLPPGGGVATDGTSTVVVDRAFSFLRGIQELHKLVVENVRDITQEVEATFGSTTSSFILSVRCDKDGRNMCFEESSMGLRIHPSENGLVLAMPTHRMVLNHNPE